MKILLATDGNAPAEAADRLIAQLVRRDRTEVDVVAVCGFETVLAEAEKVGRYDPAAGRRRAQAALDATVARLTGGGVRAAGTVEEGDPAGEVLAVAARRGADVIAVGAGHTRLVEALVLGSTSSKILHTATQSVLVVHAAGNAPVRVLVGADGSAGSAEAVRTFADLADPARCAVLVLAVTGTADSDDDVRRSARETAEHAAEETAQRLRDDGFAPRMEIVDGDPATELLDRAAEHDLVVVGSRGMGFLRRALLGSVSDALARRAPATLVGR